MHADNHLLFVIDDSVDAQGSQALCLSVAAAGRHDRAAGQQRQLSAHVARGASCSCHKHRLPLLQRPACCLHAAPSSAVFAFDQAAQDLHACAAKTERAPPEALFSAVGI